MTNLQLKSATRHDGQAASKVDSSTIAHLTIPFHFFLYFANYGRTDYRNQERGYIPGR